MPLNVPQPLNIQAEGGKPWVYLLIPHDRIKDNTTLAGLAASCRVMPPAVASP
jgi:hypothetical protein